MLVIKFLTLTTKRKLGGYSERQIEIFIEVMGLNKRPHPTRSQIYHPDTLKPVDVAVIEAERKLKRKQYMKEYYIKNLERIKKKYDERRQLLWD